MHTKTAVNIDSELPEQFAENINNLQSKQPSEDNAKGTQQNTDDLAMNEASQDPIVASNTTDSVDNYSETCSVTFKKPNVLTCSKRVRVLNTPTHTTENTNIQVGSHVTLSISNVDSKIGEERSKDPLFSYVEPSWAGKPEDEYKMEILKSGVIMGIIDLSKQSFHVIGRLPSSDISLAHPTISRYHAILQYRSVGDATNSKGLYIYDLESTHGTFWNGSRIKPNVYVRVQGGHIIKFGCSQRKYILQAPPDDQEEESQFSITELKEKRILELEERSTNEECESEMSMDEKESEGIDWGLGEDADETTDLEENPYASIVEEDLVLDDPKKTLRGWFEREGYDLQYQTEEKGVGQFLCWINIPMENVTGRTVRAEALVKGKKKEAVLQCALEACRILDKYGLLRQATHEARKRKTRNWEEEDYYDSDEDNYLDRTGSIEKKREQRMRIAGKLEEKVETYDSLLKKYERVTDRITYLINSIESWQKTNNEKEARTEEDALDAFMSSLSTTAFTKSDIAKMKLELQNLRKEEAGLIKLLNLTRPAYLPALACQPITVKKTKLEDHTRTSLQKQPSNRSRTSTSDQIGQEKRANQQLSPEHNSEASSDTSLQSERTDFQNELYSNVERIDKNEMEKDYHKIDKHSNPAIRSKTLNETVKLLKQEAKTPKRSREHRRNVSCDQDICTENYSTWVPPQDQVGDGKTSLNEKYGY